MQALGHELRLFFVALQFLTRMPAPSWVGYDDAWMNHCVRHFPLVGGVVGACGALVLTLALALFPAVVAVLLSMSATVWLTGAFHEDGLADTCDGLGGAVGRARALEIMKDSRIGTYGAAGLMLALGLKAALLTELVLLDPLLACLALVWGHAASRTAAVCLMRMLPYAGDAGYAKAIPLARAVRSGDVAVALVWVALLSVAAWFTAGAFDLQIEGADLALWSLSAALPALGGVVWLAARWLRKRLGGYTGDTLGATQQVAEITALLAWLAVAHGVAGMQG